MVSVLEAHLTTYHSNRDVLLRYVTESGSFTLNSTISDTVWVEDSMKVRSDATIGNN
jgi:hypothetical protein